MTYKDNAVKDLRIAYIGGGSRGWAWTFMRDLALEPALGGTIVLYDIDKEAAKANEIIGNGISEREEAVGKWKYIVADTLKEALTGSDFVVISILPGTFDEMESDVHEPEKYGIYQSVGDISRSWRNGACTANNTYVCYNRRGNSRLCATGMGYQLY